jgi:hypothetical protein
MVDASANYYTSGSLFCNRFWRCAFYALLLLECVPIWIFRYSPSTDGPSHLYNASVLANYGIEIYRRYYTITLFQPAGNVLSQYILIVLLKLTGPVMAEKAFLSGYIILFFLSFRYFLRALTPYADYFSCSAGVLALNSFFYMGFWNYSYSVCLVLIALGYYLRQQKREASPSPVLLTLVAFVIYATHAVSWLVYVIAVTILVMTQAMSGIPRRGEYRLSSLLKIALKRMLKPAKVVCGLALPGVCTMIYYWMNTQHEVARIQSPVGQVPRPHESSSTLYLFIHQLLPLGFINHLEPHSLLRYLEPHVLLSRLEPLYSILYSFNGSELILSEAVAGMLFIALLVVVGVAFRQRQYNVWNTGILLVCLTCSVLAIAGPSAWGTGQIRLRLALYAWLFVVAWLAVGLRSWPRVPLNVISALFCCVAVVAFAVRLPALSKWNKRLSAFAVMGRHLRPESTVLHLTLEHFDNAEVAQPYLHAVDLLSTTTRPIIDLRNYEAFTYYFSTRFRPEVSPFPALGTKHELEATRPVFDITRYEKETRGRVEYLLFQGGAFSDSNGLHGLEETLYRDQISAFTFLAAEEGGNLRLYERVPARSLLK